MYYCKLIHTHAHVPASAHSHTHGHCFVGASLLSCCAVASENDKKLIFCIYFNSSLKQAQICAEGCEGGQHLVHIG